MINGIIAQLDGKLFYYHSCTRMDKRENLEELDPLCF